MRNPGYNISDQTVGNILRRNGIPPVPRRKPAISWTDFIKMHEDVLVACDFFTAEVFTAAGLVTYYVLFFIKIGSRDVHIAGMTPAPERSVDDAGRAERDDGRLGLPRWPASMVNKFERRSPACSKEQITGAETVS